METRLLPRLNIALAVRRTAKIDAHGNQVGTRPALRLSARSSISQAPGCGQTPPLPTPSGPPSPATTPNSNEWRKAGIAIVNIMLDAPPAPPTPSPSRPEEVLDDSRRAWSSALFPIKPERPDSTSNPTPGDAPAAEKPQPHRQQSVQSPVTNATSNGLFVPRSSPTEP